MEYFVCLEVIPAGTRLFTAPHPNNSSNRVDCGPTRWDVWIVQTKQFTFRDTLESLTRVSSVLVNDAELHEDKSQDEVVKYMDPPQDYPEALSRPDAKHWKKCTKLEMDTLCKNKTWTEVTKNLIPKGINNLKSR